MRIAPKDKPHILPRIVNHLILSLLIVGIGSCVYQFPLDSSTDTDSETTSNRDTDTNIGTSPDDTIPPTPGNGGTLEFKLVLAARMTLSWAKSSDNFNSQADLEYKVIRSPNPDIDTLKGAEEAATVQDWTKDIDTADVVSLIPSTKYYFNVLVRDLSGNTALYKMADKTTLNRLEAFTAFFPFSGSIEDNGPHKLQISSIHTPNYDANRDATANASLYFDSTAGDFLYNTDHPSPLGIEEELTVSAWVKLEDAAVDQKIVGRAFTNGSYWGWVLAVNDNKLCPEIWDSSGTKYNLVSGDISTGVWTHLAITWKTGGKFRGFVDGIMVQEVNAGSNPIANVVGSNVRIGCRPWSHPSFFVGGNIDDIRVYDFELAEAEIMSLKTLSAD